MKRRELLINTSVAFIASNLTSYSKVFKKTTPSSNYHSLCRWCYGDYDLELLAEKASSIGYSSIELLDPNEWRTVQKYGLTCALSNGSKLGISQGFNDTKNHQQLLADYAEIIPLAAENGIENIICFSGNRNALTDEVGLENCAIGLTPVLEIAQKHNVTLVMELLNSKIDHPDYQCDHTQWGVDLVNKIGNPQFKLLYDIYHMQIMEGDVIRTIQNNIDYIGHFHTGGVPGRNEIDHSQELNYHAIIKAIFESGYGGYIGQEFIPKKEDPFTALEKAMEICQI